MLPPSSASPAEVRDFIVDALCADMFRLLPTYHEEIRHIYDAWTRPGEFLRNADPTQLQQEIWPCSPILAMILYAKVLRLKAAEQFRESRAEGRAQGRVEGRAEAQAEAQAGLLAQILGHFC